MRNALFLTVLCWPLSGAITNVRVLGTTSTQAILGYTAPDGAGCSLEVSESESYSLPVPDADPQIFTGADHDDRAGSLVNGRNRVFVVGKRAAEKGDVDGQPRSRFGYYVSRALQAYTMHYFRISCGADRATGSFQTSNIPLGNAYPEPYPVDPAYPGQYAWPTLDYTTVANEAHADPRTGALIRRATGSKTYMRSSDITSLPRVGVFEDSGAWTLTGGNLPAQSANGAAPAKLSVAINTGALYTTGHIKPGYEGTDGYSSEVLQVDSVRFAVTAETTATGDNAVLYGCLSVDMVTCAHATPIPVAFTDPACATVGVGCTKNFGGTSIRLSAWLGKEIPTFDSTDLSQRAITATYNDGTGELTWNDGNYFSTAWTGGTRVWSGSTAVRLTSVGGPKSASAAPGLGLGSPVTLTGYGLGILLWKKPSTTGTVTVRNVTADAGLSYSFSIFDSANWVFCSPATVQYSGEDGYHCLLPNPANGAVVAWIGRRSGTTNILGELAIPAKSGADGWQQKWLTSPVLWAPANGDVFHTLTSDSGGNSLILKGTYTGDNSPSTYGVANSITTGASYFFVPNPANYTNVTPQSGAYSLPNLIAAVEPRYSPAPFWTTAVSHDTVMYLASGTKDSAPGSWTVVYDTAITPGPGSNPVKAVAHTALSAMPLRWCAEHTLNEAGPGWMSFGVYTATAGTDPGGQFATTLVSDNDGTITVSAQPLFDAVRAGDVLMIGSEYMSVVSVNGLTWTVTRPIYGSTKVIHGGGATVQMVCGGDVPHAGAMKGFGRVWWNWAADPTAANAGGDTLLVDYYESGHGTYSLGAFTLVASGKYSIRQGTPALWHDSAADFYSGFSPVFAGAAAYYDGGIESHVLRTQVTAKGGERSWVMDGHQFQGTEAGTVQSPLALHSGQLYKISRALPARRLATIASCGSHPLLDVSGPADCSATPGDPHCVGDSSASAYRYCVPNAVNECHDGAAVGEVWANCPGITFTSHTCYGGNDKDSEIEPNGEAVRDICVFEGRGSSGVMLDQTGVDRGHLGTSWRAITSAFARYRRQAARTYDAGGWSMPGGEWAMVLTRWAQGWRNDLFLAKIPAWPAADSSNRGTFFPLPAQRGLVPPGTNDVIAEFGYDPNFYCTSRQEVCIAHGAGPVTEATPFHFAQSDRTNGMWDGSGLACASGCTLTIPALPQRVVYYRLSYRAADGTVLLTTSTQAATTP